MLSCFDGKKAWCLHDLMVTSSSLIGLKAISTRKKQFLVLKPSQRPRADEVMYLGGESTTIIFLSQHNSWLHSKYEPLNPQVSLFLAIIWETSFCNRDHYRKPQLTKKQRIRNLEIPSFNWYIYSTSSIPRDRGSLRKKRQKDCKSLWNRESAVSLCLLEISERLHSWILNNMAA